MKAEPPQCWRHLLLRSKRILKAHPLICLSVGLTLLFATVTARVRAQQSAATSAADTLQAAIALYEQGEARLAQPMFGAIAPSSPAYGAALAYDSLCRYEICRADVTNGYSWFLDGLKAPALQQATLPAELQEELAFKQIDALYVSRQFGSPESLSLITEFRTTYPASARLPALTEYELAAWCGIEELPTLMAFRYGALVLVRVGFDVADTLEVVIRRLRAMPRRVRTCGCSGVMSSSRNRMVPGSVRNAPEMQLISVVLPEPFGPSRP